MVVALSTACYWLKFRKVTYHPFGFMHKKKRKQSLVLRSAEVGPSGSQTAIPFFLSLTENIPSWWEIKPHVTVPPFSWKSRVSKGRAVLSIGVRCGKEVNHLHFHSTQYAPAKTG